MWEERWDADVGTKTMLRVPSRDLVAAADANEDASIFKTILKKKDTKNYNVNQDSGSVTLNRLTKTISTPPHVDDFENEDEKILKTIFKKKKKTEKYDVNEDSGSVTLKRLTKTISTPPHVDAVGVRWSGLTDQPEAAQAEVTFVYAKNLFTKEETAAEEMWGDRWDVAADDAGVSTKTILRVPWRGKTSR